MRTKNFKIDPVCITEVIEHREWSAYDHMTADQLTVEQILKILKGQDRYSSIGSHDHPEFAALRDQLEAQGYIQIQRQWCNGDRVLRPFRLNGCFFRRNEQFPSAAAMSGHLKYWKGSNER